MSTAITIGSLLLLLLRVLVLNDTNTCISCPNLPIGSTVEMMREAFGNIAHSGQTALYLRLQRNHLEVFPSNMLDGIMVTHLSASYNNISIIDGAAFSGHEENLESLDLSQNRLVQVCAL